MFFEDLVYLVIFSNLTHHGYFLIVVAIHLNIGDDILQQNSSATVTSHLLGHFYMSEVNMQVIKSWMIVEQGLDEGS